MMEELISGNTLLVGEGDFSFAVSLVEKLPSNKYSSIIATSLETTESIKKHQYAAQNISWLKEKGVTVRLDTDATQLHVSPFTKDDKFSCIIFNFPHAGGKSNHKKNRKLLNDFFASAVQVLESEGKIMMTLCKGQGGTPADRPMRAWHDSWQVVSMAANSSLILTRIIPFQAEEYRVYTSTGFRSLDKGFNTENALTHVFEKGEPVAIPDNIEEVEMHAGKLTFLCPAYIYKKLIQIRCIGVNTNHPVHRVYEKITQCLDSTTTLGVKNHGLLRCMKSCSGSDTCDEAGLTSDRGRFYKLVKSENSDLKEIDGDASDHRCGKQLHVHGIADSHDSVLLEWDPLNFLSAVDHENIQTIYGPVCKPCIISQNQSPVSYYVTIVWPVAIDEVNLDDSDRLQDALTKVLADTTDIITTLLNDVISKSECEIEMVNCSSEKLLKTFRNSRRTFHVANINLQSKAQTSSVRTRVNTSESKESTSLGACHVKSLGDHNLHYSHNAVIYITIDLCKLTCSRYGIEDERLLWSRDSRVLRQFPDNLEDKFDNVNLDTKRAESGQVKLNVDDDKQNSTESSDCSLKGAARVDHQDQHQNSLVKSPSLYPMTFIHDMSFWENQSIPFNEQDYCDIIRDVADDNVIRLELIDIYNDAVSGNRSRCYRLTFQSVDRVLSYSSSWKLQSLIRLEVERKMKIGLR